jgi:hypothetical protein
MLGIILNESGHRIVFGSVIEEQGTPVVQWALPDRRRRTSNPDDGHTQHEQAERG